MSTDPRYLLASRGVVTYGIEDPPYDKADPAETEFGVTSEDIDPPNENPQTPMPTGGHRRGPYVFSPDEKDHEFDVPTVVHNADVPLECALGSRTTSTQNAGDADEYERHLFEEAARLPTMTVRHVQDDADFVAYYVGAKANLDVSWSQGDPLEMSLGLVAAALKYDDAEAAPSFNPTLATDVSPFRAHMAGDVVLSDPSDDSTIKELATVSGGDSSWDNGLEAQHHGDGRGAYAVAETTAAEKYDHTLTWNVTDTDLYERVHTDDALVDVEVPFARETVNGTIVDGVIIRYLDAKLIDGPMPNPSEGVLEGDVSIAPRTTEIEIRNPA